jgi:PAS domain S-box-containing protein
MSSSEKRSLREKLDELDHRSETTVLHVDDEPEFADLVAVYLEREGDGLSVVTETSAEAGLDRLAADDVDCIVSDYDMPGTDGLGFLDAVRTDYPDLPFILFTGKGSEEIASEAISAGVTDYLQKRGGTDQYTVLANRIENAVKQHRAAREVERGFHAIETTREGIAFLDEAGTFRYVNPAYADTYGYDREELIGEHWEILYPDEHVDQVYDEILPSLPDAEAWSGESVHRHRDGTRLIVDHALSYCSEGTLLCFIRDITERTELERALERERRRFEEFVDAVEEYAIVALDPDGHVTSWNRGVERLLGYDREGIVGEHVSTLYPEERVEEGSPDELLAAALDGGSVTDTGWRVREDGSEFWATAVITAVVDDDGVHRGYLEITRDATRNREDRRALEAERDFLDEALDVLDDVFYAIDETRRIVRVTDRATTVTGYDREELLSMSPVDLFPPSERQRVRADMETAFETGSATIEAPLLTKGGETRPFEFRKRRFEDADGTVFLVGIARDISERKRRERQLERQLDQFEQFGGVLSHDLRTPLNTARGRLELARETGDDDHLDRVEAALDRLGELVEDLAEVMREGELVREETPVELAPCLRAVWESMETTAATLTVETDATVRADEEALKRLLENLFKNALEHAGDDVHVTVGSLPTGFYVADDGPGIPPDERDRIFEVGYSTKESSGGFGMASVRQLVIAHGWEITVTEGTPGGARFEIADVETE